MDVVLEFLLANFNTPEHFRRVEDFKRIFARFEGLDEDRASNLELAPIGRSGVKPTGSCPPKN